MSEFVDFKSLLPRAIERYKMTRATRAAQICARFSSLAPGIIGGEAVECVKPKYFKGGTLTVSVPSSIWAQRVYVHRHDLIMKLNLDFEKEWVHEIRALVESA